MKVDDAAVTKESIYAGAVHVLAPSDASRALVGEARAAVEDAFEAAGDDVRAAEGRLTAEAHFARVTGARRAIASSPRLLDLARGVLRAAHFDVAAFALDAPRLRAIPSGGYRIAAARSAYAAHRDTWYANPRAQINVWIPLFDVGPRDSFAIYPRCFARAVANDSEAFDYDDFRAHFGWQSTAPPARGAYPEATGAFDESDAIVPTCAAGSVVLFAAAHLHRTLGHDEGRTRFSVDFRAVHLDDHARGAGAPDVDVRCRGSALIDYARPRAE